MKDHKLHIILFYVIGALSVAIGLSLDTLPRHIKQQTSTHKLYDSDLDFENNFVHSKRTPPALSGISHSPSRSALHNFKEHKRTLYEDGYPPLHSFHDHVKIKRKADDESISKNKEVVGREELTNILKDDESDKNAPKRERKIPPDTKRQESIKKKKRESKESSKPLLVSGKEEKPDENEEKHEDFQEWLKKEYYRNMARNFASMRRKRAMWGPVEAEPRIDNEELEEQNDPRRMLNKFRHESSISIAPKKEKENRFDEVTSNLKAIEDALLADALDVVKGGSNNYEDDYYRRQRVSNDLNAAYDIETMRSALFRLRDTLYSMEEEMSSPEEQAMDSYGKHRKRNDGQCAPLNVLTSDCSALGDIVPDDSLRDLLTHACNWHEVCYTCGEVFGLSSDNCDMGFVEQSRTICRGDVPCESTARLLLLPLRQRRVFFKRSNPSVCLVDPCVEEFLTRV